MKLYGGASGARTAAGRAAAQQGGTPRKRNTFKALAVVLIMVLFAEICYFVCVFSKNDFITKWRNIYISTAMETMSHQWLATAIIPREIIDDVMLAQATAKDSQVGLTSHWQKEELSNSADFSEPDAVQDPEHIQIDMMENKDPNELAKEQFYELFHELDMTSFEAYLADHPETLANGWQNLVINEAGLDDEGTDIQTIYGEQVLAIDFPNQILLIRIKGSGYQGILAVAKDPSRLSNRAASTIGEVGQTVGTIAAANNGILAMNGSGFMDDNGGGDGGTVTGFAMCDGVEYGYSFVAKGEKRLELHEDNLMYIYDTSDPVSPNCTDAVEWHPAIVVDGEDVVGMGWDGLQPRACIGQSDKYEVLMLVIEGRQPLRSVGITLYDCVDILLQHGCMQAINLDGGTSAMMWYDGEPIISCSNSNLIDEGGRPLPTAWVYEKNN